MGNKETLFGSRSLLLSGKKSNEDKVNKKFKKFAKALNELHRKEGDDILKIEVDAEIFNDREMRWGYKVVNKNKT